jgi:hypothetical protein
VLKLKPEYFPSLGAPTVPDYGVRSGPINIVNPDELVAGTAIAVRSHF